MVYLLRGKSDTLNATGKFLAESNSFGVVKRLPNGNGTEFSLSNFWSLKKIKQELSAPYSPHQNGTAETLWRILFGMFAVRGRFAEAVVAFALKTSAYMYSRCFNTRANKTPYEMLTGRRPNFRNLHMFGETCYVYQQHRKEFDARSEKEYLLVIHQE